MQLHKAKGGTVFKVYAAFLSIGLVIILLSGYLMALQSAQLRRATLLTTALGFIAFAAAALLS